MSHPFSRCWTHFTDVRLWFAPRLNPGDTGSVYNVERPLKMQSCDFAVQKKSKMRSSDKSILHQNILVRTWQWLTCCRLCNPKFISDLPDVSSGHEDRSVQWPQLRTWIADQRTNHVYLTFLGCGLWTTGLSQRTNDILQTSVWYLWTEDQSGMGEIE